MTELPPSNRILIVAGHYGSGKTEFAVSYALQLAQQGVSPLAVVDLDIANPYFRSRERRGLLETHGIGVYGSLYDAEITAELPALGAALRAPLENKSTRVIIDAGGNDSGALVLNQFRKYFTDGESSLACVVNFRRFETRTVETAAEHIAAIERVTGLRAEYLINNTHLLRETTPEIIAQGHILALETCETLDKKLFCTTYPESVVTRDAVSGAIEHEFSILNSQFSIPQSEYLMPLGLYMRPEWLDK